MEVTTEVETAVPGWRTDATGTAFDAARRALAAGFGRESACIGCGACVAACKNASAMLFLSAKVTQLARLPQGQPERQSRALKMLMAHDMLGFGNCSNEYECAVACPKGIDVKNIAKLNREFIKANVMRKS